MKPFILISHSVVQQPATPSLEGCLPAVPIPGRIKPPNPPCPDATRPGSPPGQRLWGSVMLVIPLVLLLFGSGCAQSQVDPGIAQFHKDAERLIEALQRYREFMNEYPPGDLTQIARSLSGQGEKDKVLIWAASRNQINARGEIVDPWGTPLEFYFADNAVLIRSAGPNRIFEDSALPGSDDLFRTDVKR